MEAQPPAAAVAAAENGSRSVSSKPETLAVTVGALVPGRTSNRTVVCADAPAGSTATGRPAVVRGRASPGDELIWNVASVSVAERGRAEATGRDVQAERDGNRSLRRDPQRHAGQNDPAMIDLPA
jgi:hypothetical protein